MREVDSSNSFIWTIGAIRAKLCPWGRWTVLDESDLAYVRDHFDFWGRLNDDERRTLEGAIAKARFPRGSNLRGKGTECLGVLLVRSGELRAYIQGDDGREVTLYRLGPGELCVLSASCALDAITFEVSIDAMEDTEAYRVNLGAFERLTKQNVWVENFSYKSVIERFSDVMWAVEQLVFMRFDKRLAIFLLDESGKSKAPEIKATHEEIAKLVGSAREVVSRMLKSFETQGIVSLGRGTIKVVDREALRRITE